MTEEKILEIALKIEHVGGRKGFSKSIYTQANKLPRNCRILDIGGFMGGSSIIMALTVKERAGLVFTINPAFGRDEDHHTELNEQYVDMPLSGDLHTFMRNVTMLGAEGYIIPLVGSSKEVFGRWDGRLFDMVFIDAWHEYEPTKIDMEWLNYTRENAIAQFDDFSGGVKEAAMEYFAEHKMWKRITDEEFFEKYGVAVFQRGEM